MDSEIHDEAEALAAMSRKVTQGGINSSRTKKDNKQRKPKKDVECYVCQERGHYARECPTRQQRKSQRGSSGAKDCALIASLKPTTSHERDDSAIGRVWEPSVDQKRGLRNTDQREAWYTDSGASAHIFFRREWFADNHPRRDGSTVVLGDNRECAVVGEGNI